MIAPGLQRRLRVLSAWGYLVVPRLCLLCFFCFFGSRVVAWCVWWWFERADFVSLVMSSPTRPAYCATDVVKRRQSKKKKCTVQSYPSGSLPGRLGGQPPNSCKIVEHHRDDASASGVAVDGMIPGVFGDFFLDHCLFTTSAAAVGRS